MIDYYCLKWHVMEDGDEYYIEGVEGQILAKQELRSEDRMFLLGIVGEHNKALDGLVDYIRENI